MGQKYGIRNAGYYALRSLRIEKFFAFWGQDLDAFTTPLECGREFRVKFDQVCNLKNVILFVLQQILLLLLYLYSMNNPLNYAWRISEFNLSLKTGCIEYDLKCKRQAQLCVDFDKPESGNAF